MADAHRREPSREREGFQSRCKRFAPLTPEGMHKLLMEKKFTNGADREVVVKLYTNVAERCIYPAETILDYYGMGFGDEEMKVLCEWFPSARWWRGSCNAFTATLGPAGGGGGAGRARCQS